MSYFKRKIYIFSSKVMCRRDGKKDTRETRDSVFESCPTTFAKKILAIGTGSFTRCSWPWLLVSVSGYRFKNRYLSPSPTGAYGHFSSSESFLKSSFALFNPEVSWSHLSGLGPLGSLGGWMCMNGLRINMGFGPSLGFGLRLSLC